MCPLSHEDSVSRVLAAEPETALHRAVAVARVRGDIYCALRVSGAGLIIRRPLTMLRGRPY